MLGRPGDTAVMPAIDAFYAQHDHELSGTDLTAYAAIALAAHPGRRHATADITVLTQRATAARHALPELTSPAVRPGKGTP